jgi:hypothetical protein
LQPLWQAGQAVVSNSNRVNSTQQQPKVKPTLLLFPFVCGVCVRPGKLLYAVLLLQICNTTL